MASSQLDGWKVKTKREVDSNHQLFYNYSHSCMTISARENTRIKITFPKTDMTNSDRHHTLPQISALEEVVRQKQREIEDEMRVRDTR